MNRIPLSPALWRALCKYIAQALVFGALFLAFHVSAPRAIASAIRAVQGIDFNGNNIATDSYDSADSNYSVNGSYPLGDLNKTKAGGHVQTGGSVLNSIAVGNVRIKGRVVTGTSGMVYTGPNGSVGDRVWVEGGQIGIQPGHVSDDFNQAFSAVSLPAASWSPLTVGPVTVNGDNYDYAILSSGDFYLSSFSSRLYIGSNVNCRILFLGNVAMTGNDVIRVSSGARVKMFTSSSSFIAGGLGIQNQNGDPASLFIFGLPSSASLDLFANESFTGVIYAPNAAVALGGGGNDTYDFTGCLTAKSVLFHGHFSFHFDEHLYLAGPFPSAVGLTTPALMPGSQMHMSVLSFLNDKYAVESSTNLTDWQRAVTNVSPFTFSDTNLAGFPQKFYRAVYLP